MTTPPNKDLYTGENAITHLPTPVSLSTTPPPRVPSNAFTSSYLSPNPSTTGTFHSNHPSTLISTPNTSTHPSQAHTSLPSDYIDLEDLLPLPLSCPATIPGPHPSSPNQPKTLILRALHTSHFLTLSQSSIILARPSLRGSLLWDCSETESGWLTLRNPVTGKFLGHSGSEALSCSKEKGRGWEGWLLVPTGGGGRGEAQGYTQGQGEEEVEGRYYLVSSHWGRMCRVGVREDGKGEAGDGDGDGGGTLVRFLDEREGREKAVVWEVFEFDG